LAKTIFHQYPKIRLLGHEENKDILSNPEDIIIIEEKIDGANFRFMIKDDRIIFGSHTQSIGDSNQEIGGNWKRCVEFVKEKLSDKDLASSIFQRKIFYGECCIKHTLDYDWDKIPPFLGFDIYSLENDRFLEEKSELYGALSLPVVPHIKTVLAQDIKELTDADVPISAYHNDKNQDKQAEGIVLKNYYTQIFAKYVRKKFKEENIKVFGGSKKWASTDDDRIVAMYCTNARIEKQIFKLIDDGNKLDLAMMHLLPKKVQQDICGEHWQDICYSNYKLDFRNIRKAISTRCLNVLKQIIVNNALQSQTSKKDNDSVRLD
jgi:ATP-dependent RNA circularization protein (DNA/RNA ligase family)